MRWADFFLRRSPPVSILLAFGSALLFLFAFGLSTEIVDEGCMDSDACSPLFVGLFFVGLLVALWGLPLSFVTGLLEWRPRRERIRRYVLDAAGMERAATTETNAWALSNWKKGRFEGEILLGAGRFWRKFAFLVGLTAPAAWALAAAAWFEFGLEGIGIAAALVVAGLGWAAWATIAFRRGGGWKVEGGQAILEEGRQLQALTYAGRGAPSMKRFGGS